MPMVIVDDDILYEQEYNRDIFNIEINDIESIEFIEPEDFHLITLPVASPGGLLIITTKSKTFGKGRKIKFNIKAWFPKGYRKAAEFYSPKYETEEELRKGTDRRTTIFWKPDVVFKDGSVQFDFYTADYKTTYSVVIEGVANNGQIVRKVEKISVKR